MARAPLIQRGATTRWADPAVVAQRARDVWTEGQVECRLIGYHDWASDRTTLIRHSLGAMEVEQRCKRDCGAKRRAFIDRDTGRMLSGWAVNYNDAPNYLLEDAQGKSMGRVGAASKDQLRMIAWANAPVVEVDDGEEEFHENL